MIEEVKMSGRFGMTTPGRMKSRVGVEEKVSLLSTAERVKSRAAMEEKPCNSIEKVKAKVLFGGGDEKMASSTTTSSRTTTTTATTSSSTSTPMRAKVGGGEEKIFVTVRVRPLSSKELTKGDVEDWECADDHTVAYKHPMPDRSAFPASYCFGKSRLLRC
jgi:hypothetical protein